MGPAALLFHVEKATVETVGASVPELDQVEVKAEAAPA